MKKISLHKLIVILHRDLGYFFAGLIIIYCLSGIALNHIDDWNPDFIIQKDTIDVGRTYTKEQFDQKEVQKMNKLVGEEKHKLFDFPTRNQVKIYYEDASFHLHMDTGKGIYEQIRKRPVFYQANVLHRNSLRGWKWASDIFGLMLILISITGIFVVKGKNGLTGRGKWFLIAGLVPPGIALIIQAFF